MLYIRCSSILNVLFLKLCWKIFRICFSYNGVISFIFVSILKRSYLICFIFVGIKEKRFFFQENWSIINHAIDIISYSDKWKQINVSKSLLYIEIIYNNFNFISFNGKMGCSEYGFACGSGSNLVINFYVIQNRFLEAFVWNNI